MEAITVEEVPESKAPLILPGDAEGSQIQNVPHMVMPEWGPLQGLSIENFESSLNLPALNKNLHVLLKAHMMPPRVQAAMEKALEELKKMAESQDGMVFPFGSYANGSAINSSDLDVVFLSQHRRWGLSMAEVLMTKMKPMIDQHKDFRVVDEVLNARVPLLKLRYDDKADVDLCVYNSLPIWNTQLLLAYTYHSPKVKQLVAIVKVWSKSTNVCGAKLGHLSSYSFFLMVIYFLQTANLDFPYLPPLVFTKSHSKRECGVISRLCQDPLKNWQCDVPLSLLVVRFFHFYACSFHWGSEVVSVRLGRRTLASSRDFNRLGGRFDQESGFRHERLHIEDPFLLGTNLNSVLGEEQEQQLKHTLRQTLRHLERKATPLGPCLDGTLSLRSDSQDNGHSDKDGHSNGQYDGCHVDEDGHSDGCYDDYEAGYYDPFPESYYEMFDILGYEDYSEFGRKWLKVYKRHEGGNAVMLGAV